MNNYIRTYIATPEEVELLKKYKINHKSLIPRLTEEDLIKIAALKKENSKQSYNKYRVKPEVLKKLHEYNKEWRSVPENYEKYKIGTYACMKRKRDEKKELKFINNVISI